MIPQSLRKTYGVEVVISMRPMSIRQDCRRVMHLLLAHIIDANAQGPDTARGTFELIQDFSWVLVEVGM